MAGGRGFDADVTDADDLSAGVEATSDAGLTNQPEEDDVCLSGRGAGADFATTGTISTSSLSLLSVMTFSLSLPLLDVVAARGFEGRISMELSSSSASIISSRERFLALVVVEKALACMLRAECEEVGRVEGQKRGGEGEGEGAR